MFKDSPTFSGYSIDDVVKVRPFYTDVLGLQVSDVDGMGSGMFNVHLASGNRILLYQKPNHQPASYTVLNFVVPDIDTAVDELAAKGIETLRYPGMHQDTKGIARGLEAGYGPDIAWFADPAGNVLAVIQDTLS